MSVTSPTVPLIAITAEESDDDGDDYNGPDIADAATDIEDIDSIGQTPIQPKIKTIKKKKNSPDSTDNEEFEGTGDEMESPIINHERQISVEDVLMSEEAPAIDEMFKVEGRGPRNRRKLKTQTSTQSSTFLNVNEHEVDQAPTDVEDFCDTDDENESDENSESDVDLLSAISQEVGVIEMADSTKNNMERPSPSHTPNINSDTEENGVLYKNLLAPNAKGRNLNTSLSISPQLSDLTDVEILNSNDSDEDENQQPVKRTMRCKRSKRNINSRDALTDTEDIYMSDKEGKTTSGKVHMTTCPNFQTKSTSSKGHTCKHRSESAPTIYFKGKSKNPKKCRRHSERKASNTLMVNNDEAAILTDVEDIEGGQSDISEGVDENFDEEMDKILQEEFDACYGEVDDKATTKCDKKLYKTESFVVKKKNRKSSDPDYTHLTDEEDMVQDTPMEEKEFEIPAVCDIQFVSYNTKPSENSKPVQSLTVPKDDEEALTDREYLNSSDEEREMASNFAAVMSTQNKTDTDSEDLSEIEKEIFGEIEVPEETLPKVVRKQISIKETPDNSNLITETLDLEDEDEKMSVTEEVGNVTDVEDLQMEDGLPVYEIPDTSVQITMDSETICESERMKSESKVESEDETDYEEIAEIKPPRKRKEVYLNDFLKVKSPEENKLTDCEDIELSDGDNLGNEFEIREIAPRCASALSARTDLEDLLASEDDQRTIYTPEPYLSNQILKEMSGTSVSTKEGSGPFTKTERKKLYKKNKPVDMTPASPMQTDTDEIITSADDESHYSRAETATPMQMRQALDDATNSKVSTHLGRKLDLEAADEVMYIKGGGFISDQYTDIEEMGISEEEYNVGVSKSQVFVCIDGENEENINVSVTGNSVNPFLWKNGKVVAMPGDQKGYSVYASSFSYFFDAPCRYPKIDPTFKICDKTNTTNLFSMCICRSKRGYLTTVVVNSIPVYKQFLNMLYINIFKLEELKVQNYSTTYHLPTITEPNPDTPEEKSDHKLPNPKINELITKFEFKKQPPLTENISPDDPTSPSEPKVVGIKTIFNINKNNTKIPSDSFENSEQSIVSGDISNEVIPFVKKDNMEFKASKGLSLSLKDKVKIFEQLSRKNGEEFFLGKKVNKKKEWKAPQEQPQPIPELTSQDQPSSPDKDAAQQDTDLSSKGTNGASPILNQNNQTENRRKLSYTYLDNILDNMLAEVEEQQKIVNAETSFRPLCKNSLKLNPPEEATFEIPIPKKQNHVTTFHFGQGEEMSKEKVASPPKEPYVNIVEIVPTDEALIEIPVPARRRKKCHINTYDFGKLTTNGKDVPKVDPKQIPTSEHNPKVDLKYAPESPDINKEPTKLLPNFDPKRDLSYLISEDETIDFESKEILPRTDFRDLRSTQDTLRSFTNPIGSSILEVDPLQKSNIHMDQNFPDVSESWLGPQDQHSFQNKARSLVDPIGSSIPEVGPLQKNIQMDQSHPNFAESSSGVQSTSVVISTGSTNPFLQNLSLEQYIVTSLSKDHPELESTNPFLDASPQKSPIPLIKITPDKEIGEYIPDMDFAFPEPAEVWYEGVYRQPDKIPREEIEILTKTSECLTLSPLNDDAIDLVYSSESSEGSYETSDSDEGLEPPVPIKAEVKLLVKTRENGKEDIELRSVRELAQTSPSKNRGSTLPRRKISLDTSKRSPSKGGTLPRRKISLDTPRGKPTVEKPTFTLQRLFVRSEDNEPTLLNLKGTKFFSKSQPELMAASNMKFPLQYDLSGQSGGGNGQGRGIWNSSSIDFVHPCKENEKFPSAYCDWLLPVDQDGQGKTSTTKTQNNEKIDSQKSTPTKKLPDQSQDEQQSTPEKKEKKGFFSSLFAKKDSPKKSKKTPDSPKTGKPKAPTPEPEKPATNHEEIEPPMIILNHDSIPDIDESMHESIQTTDLDAEPEPDAEEIKSIASIIVDTVISDGQNVVSQILDQQGKSVVPTPESPPKETSVDYLKKNEDALQNPLENWKELTNDMIQHEINFQGWSEPVPVKPAEITNEPLQKQIPADTNEKLKEKLEPKSEQIPKESKDSDVVKEELLKPKKSKGLFKLFGKKESRESDESDSHDDLKGQYTSDSDRETDKKSSERRKKKRGKLFGMFKKEKKEKEVIPKVEEQEKAEVESSEKETKVVEPQEQTVQQQMVDTARFLMFETETYEDVRIVYPKPEAVETPKEVAKDAKDDQKDPETQVLEKESKPENNDEGITEQKVPEEVEVSGPEVPKRIEIPDTADISQVADVPKSTEVPKEHEVTKDSETTKKPEASSESEVPKMPAVSKGAKSESKEKSKSEKSKEPKEKKKKHGFLSFLGSSEEKDKEKHDKKSKDEDHPKEKEKSGGFFSSLTSKIGHIKHDITETIEETKQSAADKGKEISDKTDEKLKETESTISKTAKDAEEKLKSAEAKAKEKTSEMATKIEETAQKTKDNLQENAEKTQEELKQAGEDLKTKVDETKKDLAEKGDETKKDLADKLDETKTTLAEKASEAQKELSDKLEETQKDLDQIKEDAKSKAADLQQDVANKIDESKEKIDKTKEELQLEIEKAKQDLEQKVDDTKKGIDQLQSDAKAKASDLEKDLKEKIDEGKEKVDKTKEELEGKIAETKQELAVKVDETKESLDQIKSDMKQKASEVKDGLQEKIEETKTQVQQVKDDLEKEISVAKESVAEKIDQTKEAGKAKIDNIQKDLQQKVDEGKSQVELAKKDLEDKVSSAKQEVSETIDQTKEAAKSKMDNIKKDLQLKVDEGKSQVELAKKDLKDKVSSAKQEVSEKIDQTKQELTKIEADTKEKVSEIQSQLKEKSEESKAQVESKITDAQQKVTDKIDETKREMVQFQEDAKVKVTDIKADLKEKVDESQSQIVKAKEDLKTKIEDKKQSLEEKADQTKQELYRLEEDAKKKATNMKSEVHEKVQNGKEQLATIVDETKHKIDDAQEKMATKTSEIKTEVQTEATKVQGGLQSKLSDAKDDLKEKIDTCTKKAETFQEEVQTKISDTKHDIETKIGETKKDAQEKLDASKQEIARIQDQIQTSAQEVQKDLQTQIDVGKSKIADTKQEVKPTVSDTKQAIAEKVDETKKKTEEIVKDTKNQTQEAISAATLEAQQKLDGAKQELASQVDQTMKQAENLKEEIKSSLHGAEQAAKDKLEKAQQEKDKIASQAKEKVDDFQTKAQDAKSFVEHQIATTQEKVRDKVDQTKEEVEVLKSDIQEKLSDTQKKMEAGVLKIKEELRKASEESKSKVDSKIEATKTAAQQMEEEVKGKLIELEMDTKSKIDQTKQDAQNFQEELASGISETKQAAFEKIGDFQNDFSKEATTAVHHVQESFQSKLDEGKQAFDSKLEKTKTETQKISDKITGLKDEAQKAAEQSKQGAEKVVGDLKSGFAGVQDSFSTTKDSIEHKIKDGTSKAKNDLEISLDTTKKEISGIQSQIGATLADAKEALVEDLGETKSDFQRTQEELESSFSQNKEGLIGSLQTAKQGLDTKISETKQGLSDTFGSFKDSIPAFGINTEDPLKVETKSTREDPQTSVGMNIDDILANVQSPNLTNGKVQDQTKSAFHDYKQGATSLVKDLEHSIEEMKSDSIEKLKSFKQESNEAMTRSKDTMETIFDQHKQEVEDLSSGISGLLETQMTKKGKTKPIKEGQKKISEQNIDLSNISQHLEEEAYLEPSPKKVATKTKSDSVCYVTTPTMQRRGIGGSQRLSKEERPSLMDISNMPGDLSSDEDDYIVTEPVDDFDPRRKTLPQKETKEPADKNGHHDEMEKRRPLFHIESSEDFDDGIDRGVQRQSSTKNETKYDVDLIEQKLSDINKALDSLEEHETDSATKANRTDVTEHKLRRVERKFERMASDTLEKDKEEAKKKDVTSPEIEAKREEDFQKIVSQLSREEVSESQNVYSNLWDEITFTPSEEWDSKTPDSAPEEIQELPQGEICYMGPVTLNKDNIVNKAGIEIDIIPIRRSPTPSPLPKRKRRTPIRATSDMGFYHDPNIPPSPIPRRRQDDLRARSSTGFYLDKEISLDPKPKKGDTRPPRPRSATGFYPEKDNSPTTSRRKDETRARSATGFYLEQPPSPPLKSTKHISPTPKRIQDETPSPIPRRPQDEIRARSATGFYPELPPSPIPDRRHQDVIRARSHGFHFDKDVSPSPIARRRMDDIRARSATGFYIDKDRYQDTYSLPDLERVEPKLIKFEIKKGQIMTAVMKFNEEVLSRSMDSANSSRSSLSMNPLLRRRSDSVTKGSLVNIVKDWMAKSSPFGSQENVRSIETNSLADTNISNFDDDDSMTEISLSDSGNNPNDYKHENILPDILVFDNENVPLIFLFDDNDPSIKDDSAYKINNKKYNNGSHEETSRGPLTNDEITNEGELTQLTTTDQEGFAQIPKPKPRTNKLTSEIEHEQTPKSELKLDTQAATEESITTEIESYSDRKKFWETITTPTDSKKRMSLQEEHLISEESVKKRASVHEIHSGPPVPKPRSTISTSLEEETLEDAGMPAGIPAKPSRKIEEEEESEEEIDRPMTEYMASFKDPQHQKGRKSTSPPKSDKSDDSDHQREAVLQEPLIASAAQVDSDDTVEMEKDVDLDIETAHRRAPEKSESIDSEKEYISKFGALEAYENVAFESDQEDTFDTDAEIIDHNIPQLKRRQMSVSQPPVAAARKTIYERSVSLPGEDVQEVSEQIVKARKRYFEEQIKNEIVIDQLMTQQDEEPEPEIKTLAKDIVCEAQKTVSSAPELNLEVKLPKVSPTSSSSQDTKTEEDITQDTPGSMKDVTRSFQTASVRESTSYRGYAEVESHFQDITHAAESEQFESSLTESSEDIKNVYAEYEVAKELPEDIEPKSEIKSTTESMEHELAAHKQQSMESDQSISSERSLELGSTGEVPNITNGYQYISDSMSKPNDSLEVHVDKSETEDSEKMTDNDQDFTSKSHSFEMRSYESAEHTPDIGLSDRHLSFEEYDRERSAPINVPREQIPDTVWEVQPQPLLEESVSEIPDQAEAHRHGEVSTSQKRHSQISLEGEYNQNEVEKLILESLYYQKVHPDEAKKIAAELIDEIEMEIEKRHLAEEGEFGEPPVPHPDVAKRQISEYLRQLAESKGLDEREVQLVESVLARKQSQISRLSRRDTQTSSMEITDEDLRYSGAECDLSPYDSREDILEEQETEKSDLHEKEERYHEHHYETDDHFHGQDFEMSRKSEVEQKTHTDEEKSVDRNVAEKFEGDKFMREIEESESNRTVLQGTIDVGEIIQVKADDFLSQQASSTKLIDKEVHESKADTTETHIQTGDTSLKAKETTRSEKDNVSLGGVFDSELRKSEKIEGGIQDTFSTEKVEISQNTAHETDSKINQKEEVIITEDGSLITIESKEETHTKTQHVSQTVDHKVQEIITTTETVIPYEIEFEGEIPQIMEKFEEKVHETVKQTFSDDSKSSQEESMKSPEEKSSSSSARKDDEKTSEVVLRKFKHGKDSSSSSSNLKTDRKSGADFETYSSSGESHYHSFEDSAKSRPCSSDVEGLFGAGSSEYESALTTQDASSRSRLTEYHTAVSSLSSRESMKSLDTESSGNMASLEISDASETLVQSTCELDGDLLDGGQNLDDEVADDQLLDNELEKVKHSFESESIDISEEDGDKLADEIPGKMKRSQEMTFQPEPRAIIADSPQSENAIEMDERFGTSLEDGSVLSMSLSSASEIAAVRTVIELSRKDSHSDKRDSSLTVSAESGQLSLEDSETFQDNVTTAVEQKISVDTSTSTSQSKDQHQIESVTITTSTIDENGTQSVCTQVTSQQVPIGDKPAQEFKGSPPDTAPTEETVEPKRRGHRRNESTTFTPSMISEFAKVDEKLSSLTLKEEKFDELKDVDETEHFEDYACEADQGYFQQQREANILEDEEVNFQESVSPSNFEQSSLMEDDKPESELLKLSGETFDDSQEPIERPLTPEPPEHIDFDSPHIKDAKKLSEAYIPTEPKRKSSGVFEEGEAAAVFSMVAHISPAHQAKPICSIAEDDDAEKHELETRDQFMKDVEQKRFQQLKDVSPGDIPDITVTQHMTPLHDQGFHYPDLELEEKEIEQQKTSPQTPASNSSKSSEETDQGREYVVEEPQSTILEEPEAKDEFQEKEEAIEVTDLDEIQKLDEVLIKAKPEELPKVKREMKQETVQSTDSPNSDSFELLEQPDIIDDFVVIEEVAREAAENDAEGKSVQIEEVKRRVVKKHDTEVEEYLVKSAPTPLTRMTDLKYYPDGSSGDEMGPFDFEDSPPTAAKKKEEGSSSNGSYEYDQDVEANKKWIEMQFQGDQAAAMGAGYGYEMEFERGPLEDIKEEEPTDFDGSSRIGSLESQKHSGGSLGSVKDSFSSTPDYDVLAGRKFFTRSGEHDDISMSSLQEFEHLERVISLENRRHHQGSQDSSSNGSFTRRYPASRGQGDDISLSSLKEFEGLESACITAHVVEVKAKEEEALLTQIDEGQETAQDLSITQEKDDDDDKNLFEIDEIIKQAQSNVEKFIEIEDKEQSLGRGDSLEEVAKVPDLELDEPIVKKEKSGWSKDDPMETSMDSLADQKPAHHESADSLDMKKAETDIMTASTDSIEFQAKSAKTENIMTDSIEIHDQDSRSCLINSDSLELTQGTQGNVTILSDSIDEEGSRIGEYGMGYDQSTSSGRGDDFSSSGKEDVIEPARIENQCAEFLIGSTDSLDPTSSTATHATYQYETDSVMSSSFTSGGSNTMVSSTDTIDPYAGKATGVDISTAVRKVWFDDENFENKHFTTEFLEDGSKPFVTEVIEPCEDDPEYSHTIHRRVEMPPEIKKISFHGPDADQQLRQYIENFGEGEDIQESETVDKDGNVHVKRVVQKRFIVKSDGDSEKRLSGPELEAYLQQISSMKGDFDLKYKDPELFGSSQQESSGTSQDGSGRTGSGAESFRAQSARRRPLRYDISLDDQTEVDPREHDWRFNLNIHAEEKEDGTAEQQQQQSRQDLHELSSEMKELLEEMEKQSKK